MNKKYEEYLSSLGMTVDGNKAYGIIQGYETNVTMVVMDNYNPFRIHFSCYTTNAQKQEILKALQAEKINFCKYLFTQCGLYLLLNDITQARLLKRLDGIINKVIGILSSHEALGAGVCPICGQPCTQETARPYEMEMGNIVIDDDCATNINSLIESENKDFNEAPNNYLRGLAGAVIGGIAGAVIAIILYLVGFVASLSAIVSVALGAFLYVKFGGKQNKMMIVIVSLTTLLFMVLSILGIYIVVSGNAAADEGLNISAFEAFSICMRNDEFKSLFVRDMLMTIGFSVFGIIVEAIVLAGKIKRKKGIKSVE